ncbi:Hypothetical predicted protein [Lecanosticta acicola]|uniref:Uncharacterized protein n=1 Tax=Lecanosticta acicola TaxID=111012 RepID=A0AAI9EC52_9PEZI|nr:Hypothetical predicted protein [Lecanosticta acicola]
MTRNEFPFLNLLLVSRRVRNEILPMILWKYWVLVPRSDPPPTILPHKAGFCLRRICVRWKQKDDLRFVRVINEQGQLECIEFLINVEVNQLWENKAAFLGDFRRNVFRARKCSLKSIDIRHENLEKMEKALWKLARWDRSYSGGMSYQYTMRLVTRQWDSWECMEGFFSYWRRRVMRECEEMMVGLGRK